MRERERVRVCIYEYVHTCVIVELSIQSQDLHTYIYVIFFNNTIASNNDVSRTKLSKELPRLESFFCTIQFACSISIAFVFKSKSSAGRLSRIIYLAFAFALCKKTGKPRGRGVPYYFVLFLYLIDGIMSKRIGNPVRS